MKKQTICTYLIIASFALAAPLYAQIDIDYNIVPGNTKPIYVNLTGLTGEAAKVLQFDLYVQGFAFTNAESAQYLITGSAADNLTAKAADRINKSTLVSKIYTGGTLRRQVHMFADDFVKALNRKPICQTKIAFKVDTGANSEVYIADFDGFDPQQVTRDGSIVAAPTWVPNRMTLLYTSYKLSHPDIFEHDLSSGGRKIFARYGGSNISPAVSPDGTRVAMILSKDGWTDVYVASLSGGEPKRLTRSRQDESSPCWSSDGQWICFAGKVRERRALCKVSAMGGEVQSIKTGVANPTEPDWSPDGQWIAFTSMMGRGFEICVVPSKGGQATQLVAGEDPTWAPNSRTLVFARRTGGGTRVLSLLDVPTKQYKDIARISGSNSQPSWAK